LEGGGGQRRKKMKGGVGAGCIASKLLVSDMLVLSGFFRLFHSAPSDAIPPLSSVRCCSVSILSSAFFSLSPALSLHFVALTFPPLPPVPFPPCLYPPSPPRSCPTSSAPSPLVQEMISEELLQALVRFLDGLVVINEVKNVKSSLSNDLSQYKRSVGAALAAGSRKGEEE